MRVRFLPLVTGVLVVLCGGFCGDWSRQVAELPCRVGGTPALVPADASASVQTGYLTEDCRKGSDVVNKRDSLYMKIFGKSCSIIQIYASPYTCIHVIRNRSRNTNRSGMCRGLCGQALFANSKGHVVVYSGTTGCLIPHDAYKVSLKQRHCLPI